MSTVPYPPVIDSVVSISDSVVRVSWSTPNITNGIITMYTIFVNNSKSDIVDGVSKLQLYRCCYYVYLLLQSTRSYDITGLSPYQLITVTITATNGGGTSDPSVAMEGRSSEAGDFGTY